ncbi:MAG: phage holin family protein [Ideonella sp.]
MSSEPGLFDSLRRASGTALSIFQSRLELATLELSLARRQVMLSAGLGLLALMLVVVGLVTLSVSVVLVLWDRAGVMALVGMGVIYLLGGVLLILKVKSQLASQPRLLQETNAELQRDASMLRGAPSDHH